jgi:cold shock CspA family protein
MVTGRILQFDHVRGYGFVGADDGGEDVFLHASVFDGDPDELAPGTKMEFKVMAGDRGRKAFAARLVEDEPENDHVPPPRSVTPFRPVAAPQSPPAPQSPSAPQSPQSPPALSTPQPVPGPRQAPAPPAPPAPLAPPAPPAAASSAPAPLLPSGPGTAPAAQAPGEDQAPEEEQMCDVLSPAELGQELTELLLENVPSLTGQQILEVRLSVLESARKHGWVDM